ncbi:MAG: type II and III secretion system protein family protein [Sneathiella sp.]
MKKPVSVFISMMAVMIQLTVSAGNIQAADLKLKVNEGKLHRLNAPVLDILITNPAIADIQLTQGDSIFVYGKKAGRTHIVALSKGDRVLFDRHVRVYRDLSRLEAVIRDQFPNTNIKLQTSEGRLIVGGSVQSPSIAEKLISLISGYLNEEEKIVNQLSIAAPLQVNLRVRILEINRQATKEIGINWNVLFNPGSFTIGLLSGRNFLTNNGNIIGNTGVNGTGASGVIGFNGGSGSVNAVIDALAEENLITILAEPNLSSRSGETASFFAGGEFPIPVSADNERVTVEFKRFGVILDMTPTVLSADRISLHIRPEVSELSTAGAVTIDNISIPGIAIRRTETTIELASGQSFSVAGLLQNNSRTLINEVPWLGKLDILGPLFRSSKFQRSETELVIVATANIVKPLSKDEFRSPLDGMKSTTVQEKIEDGKLLKDYPEQEFGAIRGMQGTKLYGPRGFMF